MIHTDKPQKTTVVRHPIPTEPPPHIPTPLPPLPATIPPTDLLPNILSSAEFPDPLADLNAFFTQMDAEMNGMGVPAWSFDDMFVEDAFTALGDEQNVEPVTALLSTPPRKASPSPSTESEQSLALDINDRDIDFGTINSPAGIMHSPADMQPPPPYQVPQADPQGINDSTMLQTFGLQYGAFGELASFGSDANILGMGDEYLHKLLSQLPPRPIQSTIEVDPIPDLGTMLASTDWTASFSVVPSAPAPTSISPSNLVLSPTLKRKDSSDESDKPEQAAKRPRGRPPKSRSTVTTGTISPVLTTPSSPSTPLLNEIALEEDPCMKRTASGKPSTARPKSVVPEKHFKDGTAQAITGMTMEQILAFPTYDELLKQVSPDKWAGAREFGDRIAENRDRAKDAAKKSRDEKRQKIEQLESQVDGLEDQVARMKEYLSVLLSSGRVSQEEVAAFM